MDSLKAEILHWQSIIDYELITVDGVKIDHKKLKEGIQSLYQKSIYAQVSAKLSYEIIEMISVIGQIKNAGVRLIRSQEAVTETGGCN